MLLQWRDSSGYPIEYLAARITAKKCCLISDWQPLLDAADPLAGLPDGNFLSGVVERSPSGVWKAMLGEYSWMFRRMDDVVRNDFGPVFVWVELKTIVICLRNLQARRNDRIEAVLESSLLSHHIQAVLLAATDLTETISCLEATLAGVSAHFCGMVQSFRSQGLPGLEIYLNDIWFRWAGGLRLPSLLSDFYSLLVDFRNMMLLYKTLRWELPRSAAFLPGGNIGRGVFADALKPDDRSALNELLQRFPGIIDTPDPSSNPESILLRAIARRLSRRDLELPGYGRCAEYLWLVYLEARNMGILLAGGKANESREHLEELLV